MVDPTEREQAALRAALALVAESMEEIGWQTRLSELSWWQALTLVEVAVTGFQDAMRTSADPAGEEPPF